MTARVNDPSSGPAESVVLLEIRNDVIAVRTTATAKSGGFGGDSDYFFWDDATG
jgi:hypothetical protein